MDEAVMILSKDGQTDYLLLANENKVEERDAESILENLSRKYLTTGAAEIPESAPVQQSRPERQSGRRTARTARQTEEAKEREQQIERAVLIIICLIALVFLTAILSSLG